MIFRWIDRCDHGLCQDPKIILLIRSLLRQLTTDVNAVDNFSLEKLNAIIFDECGYIATVWTDDYKTLIGIGMLTVKQHMLRNVGYIDEIVIDELYRGKGFGKEIVKRLIDRARLKGVHHIDLSTRSHRVVALKLYASLGFQEPETRFLRLHL